MKKPYGHTLTELLVILSVIAIAAQIASQPLSKTIEAQKQTETLNQMLGLLGYTRSAAVFARQDTVLCSGESICDGSTTWSHHLSVFHDLNGNGQRDPQEPLLREETLPKGYSWYWASFRQLPHTIFEADGTTQAANGTMTLCHAGQPQKQVIINLTGRIRYQQPAAGAKCH